MLILYFKLYSFQKLNAELAFYKEQNEQHRKITNATMAGTRRFKRDNEQQQQQAEPNVVWHHVHKSTFTKKFSSLEFKKYVFQANYAKKAKKRRRTAPQTILMPDADEPSTSSA